MKFYSNVKLNMARFVKIVTDKEVNMKLIIPFKTPTINHLYWHRGNMRIMKTEAKDLQQKIWEIVALTPKEDFFEKKLKVTIEVHENWLTANGDVYKKDISNREKFLTDSIFKALGIDDKYIYELSYKKVQNSIEQAIVSIEPFLESSY